MANEFTDAINSMRYKSQNMDTFIFDSNYIKWLPYLGIRQPHPLQADSDEVRDAKEIFNFFKENFKESPFTEFINILNSLPIIPTGTTKLKQVLSHIQILKLAKEGKIEHGNTEGSRESDRPVQESNERESSVVDTVSSNPNTTPS